MKHLAPAALLAMAMAVLPGLAQAQPQSAVTAKNVNLRAGPARDYPVVAVLPPGFPLTVQGCLPEYTWCDVIAGASRGWMYAGNINYYYQGSYVPVPSYAPLLGIAVLGFILDDYWGDHYYDRPWYPERRRWIHRPAPQPRFTPPPPRPSPPPPRPAVIGPRPVPGPDLPRVRPVPHAQPGAAQPPRTLPQPRVAPPPQTQPRVAPPPQPQPRVAPVPKPQPRVAPKPAEGRDRQRDGEKR